jgi:hypothetical protein
MMNVNDQDDEDRIVTLSTLEEVGALGHGPYVQIDKKYNIDETYTLGLRSCHFFLVSGLCSLTNLTTIKFTGLVSFPAEELSRLPNLTDLHFYNCRNFAAPNSRGHQLNSLKRFTMLGNGPQDSNFNDWIVRSLPVLEELHYSHFARPRDPNPYPNEDRQGIYTTLQSDDCVFNQSLQFLKVNDWRMVAIDDIAYTIFTEFMPKFPNLRHIDTRHCRFCTFEVDNSIIMHDTGGTVVTSTSSHEATVNDNQDRIVTLSTFNEIDEGDRCRVYNKIDREYNIDETTTLSLHRGLWLLNGSIGRLTNLTKINLYGLVSFPLEQLTMLPNLTDLNLSYCGQFDVPDSVQLKSLKSFAIRGTQFWSDPIRSNFDKWIVRSFPVLDELNYCDSSFRGGNHTSIYTTLQRDDCVFNQSLRILRISTDFDKDVTETIIVDIIPKFPNVRHLDTRGGSFHQLIRGGSFHQLNNNTIFYDEKFMGASSLKNIAQRLKQIDTSNIQLRTILGLLNVPLRLKMTTYPNEKQIILRDMRCIFLGDINNLAIEGLLVDPGETQAMLSILSSFRYLYNIGNYRLNQDVESRLRINHGGGSLVDCPSQRDEPIPLSYWPMILERVCEQSKSTFAKNISYMCGLQLYKDSEFVLGERNAAGIHNLVRNGPLFQHMLQLGKMKVPAPPRRSISRKRKDDNQLSIGHVYKSRSENLKDL